MRFLILMVCTFMLSACIEAVSVDEAGPAAAVTMETDTSGVIRLARLDDLPAALDRVEGARVLIRVAPGIHELSRPLNLPSRTSLVGAGQGVTVIKARAEMGSMIVSGAPELGVEAVSMSALTLDCDGRAREGATLIRAAGLSLSQITAINCLQTGMRVSGRGVPTRGATLSDITVTRNRGDGLMVLWASRNVQYTNIFAFGNGGTGVIFDHSEGAAANIIADQNGGDGIFFRNLFAFSASNLTATRNGRNGVLARGFVASTGQGWVAMGNSTSAPGRFDELRFTAEDDLSYGVTRDSALANIIAGGYEAGSGPATAGRGLGIDPGVGSLEVSNLVTLALAEPPQSN